MNLEINKITRGLSMAGMLSLLILTSCEEELNGGLYKGRDIRFSVSEGNEWHTSRAESSKDVEILACDTVQFMQGADEGSSSYSHTLYNDDLAYPSSGKNFFSRATPVTGSSMHASFGISAYTYTGTWDETKLPNHFYNVSATKSGSYYELATVCYWPGVDNKIRFFAYAPNNNGQYLLSSSTHAGSPTLSVTIPGSVNNQVDLLVAQTGEMAGDSNTAVELSFNHVLTAIKFEWESTVPNGTLKSISLKNIYSKGVFNMGTSNWSTLSTPATFSQTLNKTTGGTDKSITTAAQTFMMIPQTLPSGSQIEVVFTDKSGNDHTLTADISGKQWLLGKNVIFKISFSNSYEDINFTYTIKPWTTSERPVNM